MMTPFEKIALLALIDKIPTTTKCVHCIHLDTMPNNYCMKWQDRIPDDVMKSGCPDWEFDKEAMPF